MTGTTGVTGVTGVTGLAVWRHHDERLLAVPGVALPSPDTDRLVRVGADVLAAELYAGGARRVRLPGIVDLAGDPAQATGDLAFVRALTSYGIVVDWRVLVDPAIWPVFGHLSPPTETIGAPDVAKTWREEFYLCKCIHRHGPGFIQIRDRRTGELNRLTLDEPPHIQALQQLLPGCPTSLIPPDVLADFAEENLVWISGDRAVWLPYRVRRWPWPALSA